MATKRHKPEEIVTKLRQVDVLVGQGQSRIDAIRRCCQTNASSSQFADQMWRVYAAETCCHSTSAASRFPLKSSREMRCLSWLK